MNWKALAVAVVLGALGVALSHVYLMRLEAEVSGGQKVPILVAAVDIPVGAVLERDQVAIREVPAAYVDRRQVRSSDAKKALGVRVSTGLRAGDTIVWTDLARLGGSSRELSALVQDGMRAINITADHLFDGLLRPGDRVDVLFSAATDNQETSTLLQNLLVLSVGGDTGGMEQDPDGAYRAAGDSVTLSVTAEQAQLIAHAELSGSLRLVVRNADDIRLVQGLPTTRLDDVNKARERLRWNTAARPDSETEPTREIEHVE